MPEPAAAHEGYDATMALQLEVVQPEADPYRMAPHRIRRCTYRRMIRVDVKGDRVYDVECLYPDRKVPIPIGDIDAATAICNACTATHIFRADED